MTTPEKTTVELAAILAGLRLLQRAVDAAAFPPGIEDIATDGGTFAPLADSQINALCERINFYREAQKAFPGADIQEAF